MYVVCITSKPNRHGSERNFACMSSVPVINLFTCFFPFTLFVERYVVTLMIWVSSLKKKKKNSQLVPKLIKFPFD